MRDKRLTSLERSRDLEDLEACEHDALEAHQHIEEVVINGEECTLSCRVF